MYLLRLCCPDVPAFLTLCRADSRVLTLFSTFVALPRSRVSSERGQKHLDTVSQKGIFYQECFQAGLSLEGSTFGFGSDIKGRNPRKKLPCLLGIAQNTRPPGGHLPPARNLVKIKKCQN